MGDMDQYKEVFLAESAEYIQQITDGLLALESNPLDTGPVEVIFRGAHSLKGMAAAMGYERTAELTHKMEGLMDRIRKGERAVDKPLIELMLVAVDFVRDLIDDESAGTALCDPTELIELIEQMRTDEANGLLESPDAGVRSDVKLQDGERAWTVSVTLEESCVLKAVRAYMVIKRLSHMGRVIETHPSARDIEDEKFDLDFEVVLATEAEPAMMVHAAEHVTEVARATAEALVAAPPADTEAEIPAAEPRATTAGRTARALPKLSETQTVRVSIGHLDTLVDLVGELVILRSRLERISDERQDAELTETVDELQRISTDLQYEVMQTRMVPVGNIFNRFPRMVRDLAVDLGKEIDFVMNGLDIELDRTVLDEIGDPLVHLLRNSIDHGIESAEKRAAAGKGARGRISLSAVRERDHVAIEVSDDGKGIDIDHVWRKACERGLVADAERADYEPGDILLFTCLPGFSTAEQTTKVSGRGVGMDVVKGKIEHLGGSLQVRSEVGRGSDFILRLPLTLAIVQSLLVVSKGQSFALPLSAVEEVFLAEDVRIDTIDGAPVVVLRDGTVVTLHRLDSILFDADRCTMPEPRSSIVLVQHGDELNALHVDSLAGRTEIVVKPLSRLFRETRGFSGATILGDGRVTLILDPRTIFTATEAAT